MKSLLLFLLCLVSAPVSFAQRKNEAYQYPITRTTQPVVLDGTLDEAAWQTPAVVSNFRMVLPMDTSQAQVRTDVRMTYDANNVYLAAVCYYDSLSLAKKSATYIVESLRRDWNFGRNDNFIVFIDTFDDQTNGFAFGVNAVGAQWDGLLFEGGKANLSWDNKWASVVKNYPDRYVVEMAIPFKTIRYKPGIARWGINFSRQDLNTTEKSAWAPVPRQFPTATLAYTGLLVWDQPPPVPGPNISLIPYVLGGLNADYQRNKPTQTNTNVGIDAKIAITSSLNLDLTVNPDFSQVDVDQQVTNLDRFELFFPERRQFFIENGDQFTNFGYPTLRPFFSRRIGLGVPIRFGARLSGKLNKDWRVGLLNMQTGAVDGFGPKGENLPAQNFAVMALQRRVAARSNIGVLFVNKQSINYDVPEGPQRIYTDYNRNLGFEYNLASSNNLWTGKLMYVRSFSPTESGRDNLVAGNIQYNSRRWLVNIQGSIVGQNYTAEAGYVPRRGIRVGGITLAHTFFPTGTQILSHGPLLNSTYITDPKGKLSDNETYISYLITFRSRSTFTMWGATDYVRLLQPFDPTNTRRPDVLPVGSTHTWWAWGTNFVSKPQNLFTYSFSSRYGGYYADGTRLNLSGELGYRFQPYVSLASAISYNDISLPAPWGRTRFWLVGPRFDLTLTNTLYLTTFVQYNEQVRNMNVNARVQWRYKPASDLFIVYTDNYLPTASMPNMADNGPFNILNRALVVKWTYWWNL